LVWLTKLNCYNCPNMTDTMQQIIRNR
jgi:hypothetical protein